MLFRGQWVEVEDPGKLRRALAHWQGVQADAEMGNMTFMQGMRLLAGLPEGMNTANDGIRQWSLVEAGAGFRELLAATRTDTHALGKMFLDCTPVCALSGAGR